MGSTTSPIRFIVGIVSMIGTLALIVGLGVLISKLRGDDTDFSPVIFEDDDDDEMAALNIRRLVKIPNWVTNVTQDLKNYTKPLEISIIGEGSEEERKYYERKRASVKVWISDYLREIRQEKKLDQFKDLLEETLFATYKFGQNEQYHFDSYFDLGRSGSPKFPVTYALGLELQVVFRIREFNFFPTAVFPILFPNMVELYLFDCTVAEGLTDLSPLTNLQVLFLSRGDLTDIPNLHGLKNLVEVVIRGNKKLRKISFTGYDGLEDCLPKMKRLDLRECDLLEEVENLHLAMPNLKKLIIEREKEAKALHWLAGYGDPRSILDPR